MARSSTEESPFGEAAAKGWRRRVGRLGRWMGGAAGAVALVLAIDVVALASIVAARREARAAAVSELAQQTRSQARALEALLATLRADLAFLASSSNLAASYERLASEDPLSRRWARLDAESTLLLFAEGHPALVLLQLSRVDGSVVATVARPESTSDLLADPLSVAAAPPLGEHVLSLTVPFGGSGSLSAAADPDRLLAAVAPAVEAGAATLRMPTQAAVEGEIDETAVVGEPVETAGWQPEGPLVLERVPPEGPLLAAVERLTVRWRTIVLLNVVVISLGLPLAVVAVRSARSAARLAAEREHAERRLELEDRLWRQERLATVGRLAANIAHEINNPLAGMTTHMTLLEEELQAADLAAAERRFPLIRQGVDRIRAIVQRALRLANPGEHESELVNLVSLAQDTITLVTGGEPSQIVHLHVDGDEEGALVVHGERAMLGQLLTNLLINALDFGAGEPVDVTLRRVADDVTIVIEDRGPGIDPQIAEHLFEPFVSGRGSTGLGLAVSLGVVRDHGGTIVGGNRDSGGARFTVRFPLAASATASLGREAS